MMRTERIGTMGPIATPTAPIISEQSRLFTFGQGVEIPSLRRETTTGTPLPIEAFGDPIPGLPPNIVGHRPLQTGTNAPGATTVYRKPHLGMTIHCAKCDGPVTIRRVVRGENKDLHYAQCTQQQCNHKLERSLVEMNESADGELKSGHGSSAAHRC